jgi:hypothetical protein
MACADRHPVRCGSLTDYVGRAREFQFGQIDLLDRSAGLGWLSGICGNGRTAGSESAPAGSCRTDTAWCRVAVLTDHVSSRKGSHEDEAHAHIPLRRATGSSDLLPHPLQRPLTRPPQRIVAARAPSDARVAPFPIHPGGQPGVRMCRSLSEARGGKNEGSRVGCRFGRRADGPGSGHGSPI